MGMHGGTAMALDVPVAGSKEPGARRAGVLWRSPSRSGSPVRGAAHAQDAGKVLVFHGPADPTTAAGVDAIEAIGEDNDFDGRRDGRRRRSSPPANLANYRAVVFLNTAGNLLSTAQENAVQAFVQGGGGFVGIGSAAQGEVGSTALRRADRRAPERPTARPP